VQRALFLALDAWADDGTPPPASRVPRLDDGTLVLPAETGFPTNIPDPFGETPTGKVTYTGLKTSRYRFDFGPGFYDASNPATFGIPTIFPPVITPPLMPLMTDAPVPIMSVNGPVYPSFVPKTDRDGNDIAGVRLPDVTVPLATYTGWALRRGAQADDGCEGSGQYIPFAKTAADRQASGDPRRSIEERYASFDNYYNRVRRAVDNMVKDRLMLCEDADDQIERLVNAGLAAGVPAPTGSMPPLESEYCHKPPKSQGR
jgi:Alpha/beta hydrolase domain